LNVYFNCDKNKEIKFSKADGSKLKIDIIAEEEESAKETSNELKLLLKKK
jgi:hypothetical protein